MNENFKVAAIIHFYRDTIFDDELIALNQCEKGALLLPDHRRKSGTFGFAGSKGER